VSLGSLEGETRTGRMSTSAIDYDRLLMGVGASNVLAIDLMLNL
jgi:hypothetical protein